jgi:hypothetical protein
MSGLFLFSVTPAKAGAQPEQGLGFLGLGTGLRRYDEYGFGS